MSEPPHPEEGAQRLSRRMGGHRRASCFETLAALAPQHEDAHDCEGSAGEPLRPLNRIHAVGFPAGLIEAAGLAERGLHRRQIVGRGPTAAVRLLRRREPAAVLALHVLRRSGAALRGLAHGGGRRMLLARAAARLRSWAAPCVA